MVLGGLCAISTISTSTQSSRWAWQGGGYILCNINLLNNINNISNAISISICTRPRWAWQGRWVNSMQYQLAQLHQRHRHPQYQQRHQHQHLHNVYVERDRAVDGYILCNINITQQHQQYQQRHQHRHLHKVSLSNEHDNAISTWSTTSTTSSTSTISATPSTSAFAQSSRWPWHGQRVNSLQALELVDVTGLEIPSVISPNSFSPS